MSQSGGGLGDAENTTTVDAVVPAFVNRNPHAQPHRPRSARGASAVEFALVLPILLTIVFGIIAFGIVFAQNLALGNAARQAARYGVVAERTCADIKTEARAAASSIGMKGSSTTVTVKVGTSLATAVDACSAGAPTDEPCKSSVEGTNVYVNVDYTSKLVIPLVLVKDTFPLRGEGMFRCEFS